MNRERAKELLPIIQAFAEGKEIERYREARNSWEKISDPDWVDINYRIKPELFESWLWFLRAFPVNGDNSVSFKSKAHALQYLDRQGEGVIIHMREVE